MKTPVITLSTLWKNFFLSKAAAPLLALSKPSSPSAPAPAIVEQPQSPVIKESAASRKKEFLTKKDHANEAENACSQSPSAEDEKDYIAIKRGEHLMFIRDEVLELKEDRRYLKDEHDRLPSTDVTNRDFLQRKIDDLDYQLTILVAEVGKDFENDQNSEFHGCYRAIKLGFKRGRDLRIRRQIMLTQNQY